MSRHDVRDLHRKLQECQRRLGTPAGQADDFRRVLDLAHAITNGMTAGYLQATSGEEPAVSLAAFAKRHLFGLRSSAKDTATKPVDL